METMGRVEEGVVFTRRASGLVRELNWLDIVIVCIAGPAASGITFFAVNTQAENPGGSIGLAFAIGLLIFLPLMITVAIMSAAMPRSGSLYVAVSRILDPSVGYLSAWLLVFGYGIAIGVLGYIVTGIIGGGFVLAGQAGDISALVTMGEPLTGTTGQTVGGVVWTAFFWAITLLGVRSFRSVMRVLFLIPFIATLVAVIYFFFSDPVAAETAFDGKWGDGTFQRVIDAAREAGWRSAPFSLSGTFNLLLVVLWAYTAIEALAYVSGEIKSPRTQMLKGFFWGTVAVGVMYIIVAFGPNYAFGDFVAAYDHLFSNDPEMLGTIMPAIEPSVPFYAAILIGSPWIGLLVALGIAIWFANSILPVFLANSRNAFALAMDRAFPEILAEVDERRGAPTWATHLTAVFGLLGVLLMTAPSLNIVLGVLNLTILFIFWPFGLAAMLLPYRRPDLYELSPVRRDFLGVPVLSILGLITFVIGLFFVIFSVMQFDNTVMLIMLGIVLIGFLVYLRQLVRTRQLGIDLSQIYATLPPE